MGKETPLISKLEDLVEEQDLVFVIPYPFLPPRFLKKADDRNLLVKMSTDLEITTHWEGARLEEYSSLSPQAAYRLIIEVLQRMRQYAKDGFEFAAFLSENGCVDSPTPACDDPTSRREDKDPAPLEPPPNLNSKPPTDSRCTLLAKEMGGEPPIPPWESY